MKTRRYFEIGKSKFNLQYDTVVLARFMDEKSLIGFQESYDNAKISRSAMTEPKDVHLKLAMETLTSSPTAIAKKHKINVANVYYATKRVALWNLFNPEHPVAVRFRNKLIERKK